MARRTACARPNVPSRISPGFAGVLQVDGYAAYETPAKGGAVRLACCWSHVCRQFYDLAAASLIATETLSRIAALYRIEAEIRGRSAEERRADRRERSRPVIGALEAWLREKPGLLAARAVWLRRSATP
jgi:hypothetical protein